MKVEMEKYVELLNSKNYSECTRALYIDGMKNYIRHGFNEIDLADERRYIDMLKKEGKKATTVNARIASLNVYNKFAGLNIIDGVKIVKEPFEVDGMDIGDYQYMLDRLLKDGKYHWYMITKVLAGTGMRIGEAMGVTFGDIRRGACQVYGKGGKQRTVYFSHYLQENLHLYMKDKKDDEKLIPYTKAYVRTAYRNIKRRYNIRVKNNPHEYRHFFARQMFDAVQDLVLIKGLLGHESLNTTSEYVKKTQTVAMQKYAFAQSW